MFFITILFPKVIQKQDKILLKKEVAIRTVGKGDVNPHARQTTLTKNKITPNKCFRIKVSTTT